MIFSYFFVSLLSLTINMVGVLPDVTEKSLIYAIYQVNARPNKWLDKVYIPYIQKVFISKKIRHFRYLG